MFGSGDETNTTYTKKNHLLNGQSESLRDLSSVWSGEVQTQNLLSSTALTYHLRTAETKVKGRRGRIKSTQL